MQAAADTSHRLLTASPRLPTIAPKPRAATTASVAQSSRARCLRIDVILEACGSGNKGRQKRGNHRGNTKHHKSSTRSRGLGLL